jgi:hypothetical protein
MTIMCWLATIGGQPTARPYQEPYLCAGHGMAAWLLLTFCDRSGRRWAAR